MDGVYVGSVNTPKGKITGKVSLKTNGNQATGILEVMGMKGEFTNGVVKENHCTFEGELRFMMQKIKYQVTGTLEGDILHIVAKTDKGNFTLQGKKIS